MDLLPKSTQPAPQVSQGTPRMDPGRRGHGLLFRGRRKMLRARARALGRSSSAFRSSERVGRPPGRDQGLVSGRAGGRTFPRLRSPRPPIFLTRVRFSVTHISSQEAWGRGFPCGRSKGGTTEVSCNIPRPAGGRSCLPRSPLF